MGGSEPNKTGKDKEAKAPLAQTTQEQSSTTVAAVNPDWSGFQAYSPMPHPGFLASSPQTHPYMWGVQQFMPPYGTPPPYVAMYPHGGIYAHPSIPPGSYPFSPFAMPSPNGIPESSGNTPGSIDTDARPSDAKEKLPIKRSKGSLGNLNVITGKNSEHGKLRGTPANGLYSKSAESRSEGSSEGSDANSQNESQNKSGGGHDSLEDASPNNGSLHGSQNGGQGTPNSIVNASMSIVPISSASAVPGPATNLNIGMDYWGAPTMHGKVSTSPIGSGIVAGGGRDSVQSQLWLQDERELKRQRRKQSNRESARRSRLRKQAECDELAHRAGSLKEENDNLRSEVNRIKQEYEKLVQENTSLKERLGEGSGHEEVRSSRNDHPPTNDTQQTG